MTVTLIVQGAKWVSKAKAAWVIGALAGGWCAQSVLRLIHWLK